MEIGGDPFGQAFFEQPRRNRDRVGHSGGAGRAVAFDDHAVEAEKHCAVVVVGIEVVAEQLGGGPRDQEPELGTQRAHEAAPQEIPNEARRALDCLKRDIARKSVGHDHVDIAARDLVSLDEAVERHRQFGGGNPELAGGVAQLASALGFFAADVEQPHARFGQARDDPRIGCAHDRELDQVARIAFGIGAKIEHHQVVLAERGQQRGERGPVDPRHRAQG